MVVLAKVNANAPIYEHHHHPIAGRNRMTDKFGQNSVGLSPRKKQRKLLVIIHGLVLQLDLIKMFVSFRTKHG